MSDAQRKLHCSTLHEPLRLDGVARRLTTTRLGRLLTLVWLLCADVAAAQPLSPPSPSSIEASGARFDDASEALSQNGVVTLSWGMPADLTGPYDYQLEQATLSPAVDGSAAVEGVPQETLVRYEGPDRASVVSGLASGSYRFRVRARSTDASDWGPWSSAKLVRVEHHSLQLTFLLFFLGGSVFLSTAIFIGVMSRRARAEEASKGEG